MKSAQESVYEMGYTQPEFERVLNSGFTNQSSPYQCQLQKSDSWLVTHKQNSLQVLIKLKPLPPRVLGMISLPILNVVFQVTEATQKQSDDFFDKFFKYFHKGGG